MNVSDKKKTDTVVIYMSCVAAIGLVLVISGAVWKFRKTIWKFICSLKTKLIILGLTGNAQQVECDAVEHNLSSKFGQEVTYDVINEKEMISFCKLE